MGIADELRKLHELHVAGGLTDEEFAQAKAVLLGQPAEPSAEIRDRLQEITRRQDAERIDREWEREREQYMVTGSAGGTWVDGKYVGGYPTREVPTRGGSVLVGVLAVGGGLAWTTFCLAAGFGAFALFGLVFVAVGVGGALYRYSRAAEYEQAESSYLYSRDQALFGEEGGGPPAEEQRERDWQTDPPPDPR